MKKFLRSNLGFVLMMLLLALVLGLCVLFGVFGWLGRYTEHGVEKEVPELWGMYEEEARSRLEMEGLRMQVIDSTYTTRTALGTIVEQNPPAGSSVKLGREIYVILNAKEDKRVPLPDLRDISYRQACATLEAIGLHVSDIRYEPSEYRDLVLDVRMGGESLSAGSRLVVGSSVDLVVGQGKGTEQVYVPNLIGKSLDEARELLLGARLIVGAVNYDEQLVLQDGELADSPYYIYSQVPRSGEWILEGSHIDLRLSQDEKKAQEAINKADEEEFF